MNIENKELMEIISKIVSTVEKGIIGRVANKIGSDRYNSVETLLKYVALAGHGNHLEIGTLFGGSAIPVALLKKELGLSGIVLCVDPLNGYYTQYAPRADMLDTQSGYPVTPKTLFENIQKFDVGDRIIVMQSVSDSIHNLLGNMFFSTAYIDGDHRGEQPYLDFLTINLIVSDYIIFDNYDEQHPDVQSACHNASRTWNFVERNLITYVMRNPNESNYYSTD